jgi:hypothetical protein
LLAWSKRYFLKLFVFPCDPHSEDIEFAQISSCQGGPMKLLKMFLAISTLSLVSLSASANNYTCRSMCKVQGGGYEMGYDTVSASSLDEANRRHSDMMRSRDQCTSSGCYEMNALETNSETEAINCQE